MKWGNKKRYSYGTSYTRTARKKGYIARVEYSEHCNIYYFVLEKGDFRFNSLWKQRSYQSEEACMTACETFIDILAERKEE